MMVVVGSRDGKIGGIVAAQWSLGTRLEGIVSKQIASTLIDPARARNGSKNPASPAILRFDDGA
jgi:hypothetical protein